MKLAPCVVQLAPHLRNPTATDPEPLGRFGRPFTASEHFDDPSSATGERLQPRRKITPERSLVGHGRPAVFHNRFAPLARLAVKALKRLNADPLLLLAIA